MFVTIKLALTGQSGSVGSDWVLLVMSLMLMSGLVLATSTGASFGF